MPSCRFAGGEKQQHNVTALECTVDLLRQVRQTARPQPCSHMHPGQNANNEVTERRESDRRLSREDKAKEQRYVGDPYLALRKARPIRAVVCWSRAVAFSAPSRGKGRYDSRPPLTGRRHVSSSRMPVNITLHVLGLGLRGSGISSCFALLVAGCIWSLMQT